MRSSSPGGASLPSLESPARLRPLAARLLEGQLVRLASANAAIDRRVGRGLDALYTGHLYRHLGYVRAADYLTERLGMSLRRGQSLLRTERALRNLPSVAAALDAGSLGLSKARIVAAVATPETQDLWLARAGKLTVRQLEDQARADRAAPAGATGPPDATLPADVILPADAKGSADFAGVVLPGSGAVAAESLDEPLVPVSFAAPGHAVAMWHWVLELIRRVAGRQEPAWRCAEFLAAEFLSGAPSPSSGIGPEAGLADGACGPDSGPAGNASGNAPDELSGLVERVAQVVAGGLDDPHARQGLGEDSGMEAWSAATQAVREALCPLGAAADPDAILSGRLPEVPGEPVDDSAAGASPAPPDDRVDPWDQDARLRALVRLRQSLVWRQGRLLRTLAGFALHKDLGFGSLGEFSAEMLGSSPRRTRYLVSLDRRLETLPQVRDAYRRGLVTWCQARLLIRVVRRNTESRWIRYARRVTVRRLEDVVTSCEIEAALADAAAEGAVGAGASDRQSRTGSGPLPPVEPEPEASAWHRPAPAPAERPLPLTFGTGLTLLSSAALAAEPRSSASMSGRARHRIVFYAPPDVARLWRSAIETCRAAAGTYLREWECLLVFVREMRDTWEDPGDPGWRQRYRILERDGWRCKAPGCTSRSHLNAHHIIFRSHQGDDDEGNLVALCVGHHQAGLHQMRIRCSGRAPDALWWELGVRRDGPPLARYFGDRIAGVGERPPGFDSP